MFEIPISTWINISVMEYTFNIAVFFAMLSLTGMYTDEEEQFLICKLIKYNWIK